MGSVANEGAREGRFGPIPAGFAGLVRLMQILRSKDHGCPWDLAQDHRTLRPYLVEETYETLDAIDAGSPQRLRDELGDLLLQIVFHAQIAAEEGAFTIDDVAEAIDQKLLRRHPHVFGEHACQDADVALKHWIEIKMNEGDRPRRSALDGVPDSLPALLRAQRISEKASSVGFDWDGPEHALKKVHEEVDELLRAVASGDRRAIEEELGDVLFVLVNLGRLCSIDTEFALGAVIRKFVGRFQYMEKALAAEGKRPQDVGMDRLDELWEESKRRADDIP
jgi:tetrapyrrole methylase family protein/MazG family protein